MAAIGQSFLMPEMAAIAKIAGRTGKSQNRWEGYHVKKDRMLFLLLIAAVVCMVLCGCKLIQIIIRYQEADSLYEDIEKEVFVPEPSSEKENKQKKKTKNEKGVKPEVDFEKLIRINEDIVAWISIPELDVEYPVTQGKDNEYYLHHAYNREESFAGSIFLDYRNTADFKNQNTILYGHNMLNGSMFGSLKHLDVSNHPQVIIYTPEAVLEYEAVDNRIISVIEEKYYQISFREEEFLSVLQGLSPKTSETEGEKILTLSTCNGNSSQRRIVRCRLVRKSNV